MPHVKILTLFIKLSTMKKSLLISSFLLTASGCAWFNSSSTASNMPQNIAPQPITPAAAAPLSRADSLTANVSDETVVAPMQDTPTKVRINNSAASGSATAVTTAETPSMTSSTKSYPALASRVQIDASGRHYIIVEKGDTLYNLAKRSNQTPSQLTTLNNITANDIQIGRKIYLD